jgi:(S)-mandelate dehydrogenase
MKLEHFHTIDDLRQGANRRIPRLSFDYLDGGEGDETGLRLNRSAFNDVKLLPHYLRDVSQRNLKVPLFGRQYDFPVGIPPIGLANFIWPGTDLILARLAKQQNIPYIISSAGTTKLEIIAAEIPDHAWFQLYVSVDEKVTFDLVRRADAAGIKVLVVTVDIPIPAKRIRDLRNRFQLPFRLTPAMLMDIATCPSWALATLRAGTPDFENMVPYGPPKSENKSLAEYMATSSTSMLDLDLMKKIRDAWSGTLVVKGVMSTENAVAAIDLGADGIIVSNHGGRQLASSPSTIEVLPAIKQAVGERATVMLDSGIRNGADIVKSICMGSDFTFSGRSFMYGVGAAGAPGAGRAFDILQDETDRTLAQIGCTDVNELGPDYVWRTPQP